MKIYKLPGLRLSCKQVYCCLLLFAVCFAGCKVIGNTPKTVKIAIIPFTTVNEQVVAGFKELLAEQGYVEGKNVEYRSLPMDGKIPGLDERIRKLLAWKPDLLLSMSTPASQAAFRVTQKIATPMIFAPVTDPLQAGIVTSLKQPGGQVTGVRLSPSNGLRLEWLVRIAPHIKRIYLPYCTDDNSSLATIRQVQEAADSLGISLLLYPIKTEGEIRQASQAIPAAAQAIFLPQDSRIESMIDLFTEAAVNRHLPLSAPSAQQVYKGALMSYGFDHTSIGRQAGRQALQILKGRKPGDLPVETAENMLYINLKAAQQIGLDIDDCILHQARQLVR